MQRARRQNKPIFLSIGYYPCHWCHVMERESYSNPAIAALLNKWFVAVKVDREERPVTLCPPFAKPAKDRAPQVKKAGPPVRLVRVQSGVGRSR